MSSHTGRSSRSRRSSHSRSRRRPSATPPSLAPPTTEDLHNEAAAILAERDAWEQARRESLAAAGLHIIDPSRSLEPAFDPEKFKAEREREASGCIEGNTPVDLRPIAVDVPPGGTPAEIRRLRKQRDRDLRGVGFQHGPPPEALECGWSEYQGGATYQDIIRDREGEMKTLVETIQAQQGADEPVYYYMP
jgi:hypothetical protein